MNVTYTGTPDFPPVQRKKIETRMAKLAKLLERGGSKEMHVVLTSQRHLQRAEITVNYYDRAMVGLDSATDAFAAILAAAEKLEKQALKQRERWRDTKRNGNGKGLAEAPAAKAKPEPKKAEPKAKTRKAAAPAAAGRVFKVDPTAGRKPMTLDEALLEMDSAGGYTVYRDAKTDKINVLVRRKDGHFDLIES